jgi:hypothetical protein
MIDLVRAKVRSDVCENAAHTRMRIAEDILEALSKNPRKEYLTDAFSVLWKAVVRDIERIDAEIVALSPDQYQD